MYQPPHVVSRSAQVSTEFTVLSMSVIALITCCSHKIRTSNALTFPDAFAPADSPCCRAVHAKHRLDSQAKETQHIPCQQHLLSSGTARVELSHSRACRDQRLSLAQKGAPSMKSARLDCDFRSVDPAQTLSQKPSSFTTCLSTSWFKSFQEACHTDQSYHRASSRFPRH